MTKHSGPKVLVFDIETAPIVADVWGLWENNVALNQIVKDWHIMAWAAKWLNDPVSKTMYMDQRHAKVFENDKKLLKAIWKLLDKADIVITQNGKAFDQKKLFARFIMNDMPPPSSFRHIDIKQIAKKHFAFTSNKLEYMSYKLNTKYKKIKHEKFGGHKLWTKCREGNKEAWRIMENYNKHDVWATEETYKRLVPWDNTINFNVYTHDSISKCQCGKGKYMRNGHFFNEHGKYQRYRCTNCGSEVRGRTNLLSKLKKDSLYAKIPR